MIHIYNIYIGLKMEAESSRKQGGRHYVLDIMQLRWQQGWTGVFTIIRDFSQGTLSIEASGLMRTSESNMP